MSRSIVTAIALGLLVGAACKKNSDKPAAQDTPKAQDTAAADKAAAASATNASAGTGPGVEAGGIDRASEGAAGMVANAAGTVEVKRLGETQYTAANADTKLYAGDVVRTGEASSATIALADESTIEVSEVSSVAIASRAGTADPASAAAVLAGMARFTVTPRTPGEGAFRVFTPAGVIVTRGTTYGVGVAASGEARVGVEAGAVDVYGLVDLAATPINIVKAMQIILAADGKVGAPAPWPADDWGSWRDETDAKISFGPTVELHGNALAELDKLLVDGYLELDANAGAASTFEATAATSAEKGDAAAYTAALPDGAATIDASFALGGRLEALTWAHAAHATLATDLYVRHPADVQAQWQVVGPRVDAAVLWPKRFEVTAGAFFEPLRAQYYVHHPRGRAHATLVGVAVPEFYAQVEPPAVEPPAIRAKVKGGVWIAPDLAYRPSPRPVWVTAPAVDWHAKVKVQPAPMRAKVGWYVRPPTLKATAFVGAKVTGNWQSKLAVKPPQPRAALAASWKVPVGLKVKIAPPDLSAAATARANVKLGADGRLVRDHRMHGAAGVKGDLKAKANVGVAVPDVRAKAQVNVPAVVVPDVKAKAGITVRDHRAAAAGAAGGIKAKAGGAVNAGAAVKVKAPEVKIKAPEVKVKAKASGSFKIGN